MSWDSDIPPMEVQLGECVEERERLQTENERLRSLLWKIARSSRRYSTRPHPHVMVLVDGGQETLDEIDEAIDYDEMGQ